MNNTKSSVVGFDKNIQSLQVIIYNRLKELWGLSDDKITGYGRSYRNFNGNGYIAEVCINNEYTECLYNDTQSFTFFFGIDNSIDHTLKQGSNIGIHLCCFADMSKITKFNSSSRLDYELRKDLYEIVKRGIYGITLTHTNSELLGVDKVLAEYTSTKDKQFSKFDNHPRHCFRFNFNLNYTS